MIIFLLGLIPATVFAVVGYFVIYASTRAEGGVRRLGQFLGVWLFALAGVSILAGLYASVLGPTGGMLGGIGQHMETMEHLEEQQMEMLRELQRN